MVSQPSDQKTFRLRVDHTIPPGDTASRDLLFYAIGYERRSRHIVEQSLGRYRRTVGVRFNENELFSFQDNLEWAESQANVQVEPADTEISAGQALLRSLEPINGFRVSIDVSSFPRTYLSEIVSALYRHATYYEIELSVQFSYSVPEFSEPASEHGPVVSFGAVRPDFVGLSETGWGLATLIGLGYEPDLALAAQQVLDPAVTWLAVPRSDDNRFDDEVATANEILLDVVDSANIWAYDVSNPSSAFIMLESIVSGLRRQHNVVLVPFGPKLFAVTCLLVSLANDKEVGVWRLSAGNFRETRDQFAAGPIYSLNVTFSGTRSESRTERRQSIVGN